MGVFTITINSPSGVIPAQTEQGYAGELLLKGELCYLGTDQKWYKTSSTTISKCSTEIRIALENIAMDNLGTLLHYGDLLLEGAPLISGDKYYVGDTLGTITNTPPLATSYQRYIGTAKNTGLLLFNPDSTYIKGNGLEIDGITIPAPSTTSQLINDGDDGINPFVNTEDLKLKQPLNTGFVLGLQLSINIDNTKFDIASGYYIITDYTDKLNPITTVKYFAGQTAITPQFLATSNVSYIALDTNGTVIQSASTFTNSQRRSLATLGAIVHSNRININTTNEIKAPVIAETNQLHDVIKAIGALNLSGNIFSQNGANMRINKSAGTIFGLGINANDVTNPHVLTLPEALALTFRYRLRDGTEYADTQNINPTQYDFNGVLTTVGNNNFTIQRINVFQSGIVRIQYGQKEYNTLSDARAGVQVDSFVTETNILENAIFRCYLIIKKEVTNLTTGIAANQVNFIPVDKFGHVVGGAGVALTYDSIVAALGYIPENIANKQNSLAVDGTGIKYPTVDAIKASNIPSQRLGSSTYSTVQHIQDLFHSSGWTSGGVITNAGGGLITVSAGTGLIRAINSDVATIYFTDFPASTPANVVLVDGSQNYIYVEYNSGTPRVIATTIQRADYNTSFLIGAVYRIGTTLHINSTVKTAISDHAGKMIAFNKEVMPYARANGSMISEVATRGFAITAGTFWNGLVRFTTNAFSTATGSFFYFYRNGVGGWTKVPTQTQINNTQYDNGTGTLATLSNNKYGIHWVFIDTDGDTYVVYGQGDYTLIEAQNEMIPASLPVEITSHGFVVGKIIIQKSATTFAQIESAFAMGFSSAMASEHNSLAGLDTGNYLHLTEAQKTIATQEATNALSGYVSAGTQTFGGVKTFTLSPIVPTPTTDTQVANKSYVDAKVADTITDGVTTIAPSQNAVFDALVLKEPANANIQTHISSTLNPHGVTKAQVGLSNVDNVQQIPLTQKGAINGVAELDAQGFVKNAQLPSYVDDVIEGILATFPATGETGKIYVDTVTNKTYRWSGTVYTVISETIALGETDSTAYRGDRGKIAYDHSQLTHDKTFVGLSNVDNTSDANKPVSTAQQTALNLKVDKVTGSSLIADTEITRLLGLSNYTHPANHPPSIITQDASNRFVTDAEKTIWNAKQPQLNGTGFVKANGTTISYDNSSYLPLGGKAADSELLDGLDSLGFIRMYPNLIGYDVNSWSTAKRGWSNASSTGWTNVPLASNNATALYEHSFSDENYGFQKYVRSDGGASLETYLRNRNPGGTFSSWYKLLHTGNFVAGTNYQTPITNPITGTGTLNYIPKFTGTGTLGDSAISDNGGTVEIISRNIDLSGSSNKRIQFNSFTNWQYNFSNFNDDFNIYDSDNTNFISLFYNGGTTNKYASILGALTVKNNGNVGIGTVSPEAKLHISGTLGLPATSGTSNSVSFSRFKNATSGWALDMGLNTIGTPAGWIQARDSGNLATNTHLMLQPNGGNVLIGTTTDNGAKLQVNGAATFASSVTAKNNRIIGVSGGYTTGDNPMLSFGDVPITNTFGVVEVPFGNKMIFNMYHGYIFKVSNNGASPVEAFRINIDRTATFSDTVTATDFIGTSDITLKENIQVLHPKRINSNYKTFNFIGSEQQRVGLVAQELEIEHPEFVRTDYNGIKSVSYTDLHNAEIAYLKDKIEKLEELVNKLIK